jgi:release factor glutamine methyltransferase
MTITEPETRNSLNRNSSFVIRHSAHSARGLLERGVELICRSDAEFVLAELLEQPKHALYESGVTVSSATAARFLELAQQAAGGTPVEYLLKTAAFLDFRFCVDERVLIPRPETEELVTRALARSAVSGRRSAVLDLGTGSGCIAIALARALPEACVVATDVSPAALEVAELNVKRYALADRIELLHSDLFSALVASEAILQAKRYCKRSDTASFDLVVANPPYIPTAVLATLSPSVRCHEPRLALDGGIDGMSIIRRLVSEAPAFMSPGALLALEIDPAVVSAVRRLLPDAAIELDIQGLERFCFWHKPL